MSKNKRRIGLKADYQYDSSKTSEENMIAERAYLRKLGVAVPPDDKIDEEVLELAKKYDDVIDESLRKKGLGLIGSKND